MILSDTPAIVDSNGVEYYLWTQGALIGYECHKGDQVYYIYLSASGHPAEDSDVFLYMGREGDIEGDAHCTWVSPEFLVEDSRDDDDYAPSYPGDGDREYHAWLHSSERTGIIEGI
jgi:hypothetical protein